MAGASADGEVNHWPAFVDVLTTVIMVVTFLLVVMSAAVMALSQKAMQTFKEQYTAQQEAKALEAAKAAGKDAMATDGAGKQRVQSPTDAEAGSAVAELGAILKSEVPINGSDKLTILSRETPDTLKLQVKAMERPDLTKGVEVKTADVLMRVDFEPLAVSFNDENAAKVSGFVKGKAQPGMKYEIWSFAPQTASQSEAQRLAFYRAAMVRNLLVKAGVAPGNILTQVRVTDPLSKDGHNVRVILKP